MFSAILPNIATEYDRPTQKNSYSTVMIQIPDESAIWIIEMFPFSNTSLVFRLKLFIFTSSYYMSMLKFYNKNAENYIISFYIFANPSIVSKSLTM